MNEPNDDMIQGELFFDQGDTVGYDSFQADIENKKLELARKMGLPIGKTVILGLRTVKGEYSGVLKLAKPNLKKVDPTPLHLQLNDLVFLQSDIEFCSVQRDESE